MSNVLDQFDTLGNAADLGSDEINTHLAELFSKAIPSASHSPLHPSSAGRPAPLESFPMRMPTPSQHFDASFDYQTYVDPLPNSFSPPRHHPFPYSSPSRPHHFPLPPGRDAASPVPPMPLPKPSACSPGNINPLVSENLCQLVSMGFPEGRATAALSACGNNLDKAIEALLEES